MSVSAEDGVELLPHLGSAHAGPRGPKANTSLKWMEAVITRDCGENSTLNLTSIVLDPLKVYHTKERRILAHCNTSSKEVDTCVQCHVVRNKILYTDSIT